MVNHDLTNVIAVLNAGITNFNNKNSELMKKLADDQSELLAKINKMQSLNIVAGLMPDDGDDIAKILDEIEEEVSVNLSQLGISITAFRQATIAALAGAGFMRVNRAATDEKEPPI